MKKIAVFVLFLLVILSAQSVKADHTSFEQLNLTSGKLISEYSNSDLKNDYKKVDSRKFMGWRVHIKNDDVKATFIKETLFSYYNDGYTPIKYKYNLELKSSSKLSLASTGSIGYNSSKTDKGFKNGLNASIKLDTSYTKNEDKTEKYNIEFEIDPGTQVDLYVYGEGKLTNGVAANYIFWIRERRGGFEYFVVTTQYQRLEKKRIWKKYYYLLA